VPCPSKLGDFSYEVIDTPIAEHDMDVLRRNASHLVQQIGIDRQMQHVLGIG
jgi:hypothetical protein